MSFFDDLLPPETLAGVRAKVVATAQAAGLTTITSWAKGGTGEQMLQTGALVAYVFTGIVAKVVRGFASLDTATDPGDVDAFDPDNVSRTPARGFLSWLGENGFGTVREDATFATGVYTFANAGPGSRTFGPDALIFTWTSNTPPSPAPTYRNAADSTIYTNPDGTVTVAAGDSIDLPVRAEEVGARSSCPSSSLSLTTTLVGCSGTNAAPIVGADREDADVFRARCRQAPARVSLGGPSAAYRYLAAKNLDGTPLINAVGAASAINRVYVSEDSSTGVVNAYYASASGPASSDDVTAANDNIESQAFAVPDAITFTGVAATATTIHVAGSVKIKAKAGVTAAAVKLAILLALGRKFSSNDFAPIGGLDQTAGAGFIYTVDIQSVVAAAFPGIYDPVISAPGGASTAIALGHVPVLDSDALDWLVTVVP